MGVALYTPDEAFDAFEAKALTRYGELLKHVRDQMERGLSMTGSLMGQVDERASELLVDELARHGWNARARVVCQFNRVNGESQQWWVVEWSREPFPEPVVRREEPERRWWWPWG